MKIEQRMQSIRLILSDMDGVLTDGGIIYDNQGIETKQFHVRDGVGIKLWQKAGHQFGILTARTSHVVKVRATELGINIIRQGLADKLPVALSLFEELQIPPVEVCYIGDDLPDIPVMRAVGLAVAVADAASEVRGFAHLTTKNAGGRGAVREVIETILMQQKRWNEILSQFTEA